MDDKTKNIIAPKRLKGFRDFLPYESAVRNKIINVIRDEAYHAGFLSIDTPSLEYAQILLGSGGEATDKEVYKFIDNGKRDVALRFDLTVPFARFVAEHFGELVFPFKRVQIGEVWRGEKPQKGRYRQFAQADLDVIGVNSMSADIDILLCIISALNKLLPSGFTLLLSNRKILTALINKSLAKNNTILDSVSLNSILIALDKLPKIGEEKVRELIDPITGSSAQSLLKLLSEQVKDFAVINDYLKGNDIDDELNRFESSLDILQNLTADYNVSIKPDLRIARGLGYYTGLVFETFIDQLPGFGSVASGGRYDYLINRFSKQNLSGVGGSIGVDRLLAALEEMEGIKEIKAGKYYVAIATEDAVPYGFSIVQKLRNAGISADIGLKTTKLSSQFKYADKLKFDYVITVGTEEIKNNTFNLKNMITGSEQKQLSLNQLKILE